jgi:ribosomal protein S18 acetylase RimI-like enzyme
MNLKINNIAPNEIDTVIDLMREFAAFEDLSKYCEITEERLQTALFGETAVVEGLCTYDGETPIGYALFYPNFASFRGQRGFHLEDIYIKAEYRGRGVGEAMLKNIAASAAARGFERIDLMVLDWNKPAIAFYEKLGAVRDDDERHFKFTDAAFTWLADHHDPR